MRNFIVLPPKSSSKFSTGSQHRFHNNKSIKSIRYNFSAFLLDIHNILWLNVQDIIVKHNLLITATYAKGNFLMEPCKGFKNWFECLSCPRLCTTYCPLEGKNVIEEMRRHIHGISVSGAEEKSH